VHRSTDGRIFQKECVSLAKHGYDVTLIARGEARTESGVKIISFPEMPRWKRIIFSHRIAFRLAKKVDADIYHLHDPELLLIAKKLKRLGKKVIFDSHERVAYQILYKHYLAMGTNKVVSWIYRQLEIQIVKKIDGVIVVTPSQLPDFKSIQKNVKMITNYPLVEGSVSVPEFDIAKRSYQLCFAGGMTSEWNHVVVAKCITSIDGLNYAFAGPAFSPYLEELLSNENWNKNLTYLGFISKNEVDSLYNDSICGMALLGRVSQVGDEGTLGNNKLFEFMKFGLPVICSDLRLWKEIIETYQCGIAVNPEDEQEVLTAIKTIITNPALAREMSDNGKRAFLEKYNWDTQIPNLLAVYHDIIKPWA